MMYKQEITTQGDKERDDDVQTGDHYRRRQRDLGRCTNRRSLHKDREGEAQTGDHYTRIGRVKPI